MIGTAFYQEALDRFVAHGGEFRRNETEIQLMFRATHHGGGTQTISPEQWGVSVDLMSAHSELVVIAACERGLKQMACLCVCGGMTIQSESTTPKPFTHCVLHSIPPEHGLAQGAYDAGVNAARNFAVAQHKAIDELFVYRGQQ